MGGGGGGDWVPHHHGCAADEAINIVLVGKVGFGKSATANSILGSGCKAFESRFSYGSVTETCQMASMRYCDARGRTRAINVIDTPGLFNTDKKVEDAGKDIIKCMDMAKDGIHAILLVFSAINRFSLEDENTIETIKMFFGDTIIDHMVLVFTYGDITGEDNWMEILANDAPEYLLKAHEWKELNVKGSELKKDTFDEYFAKITKMVEEKLHITIERKEKQLLEERKARQEAEDRAQEAMGKLRESLEKAEEENRRHKESEKDRTDKEEKTNEQICELQKKLEEMKNKQCIIL
ncbi:hypothetical protein ACP4OV_024359 [Aristida adscensionis]